MRIQRTTNGDGFSRGKRAVRSAAARRSYDARVLQTFAEDPTPLDLETQVARREARFRRAEVMQRIAVIGLPVLAILFDLKAFNDAVVLGGNVRLDVLAKPVDEYTRVASSQS